MKTETNPKLKLVPTQGAQTGSAQTRAAGRVGHHSRVWLGVGTTRAGSGGGAGAFLTPYPCSIHSPGSSAPAPGPPGEHPSGFGSAVPHRGVQQPGETLCPARCHWEPQARLCPRPWQRTRPEEQERLLEEQTSRSCPGSWRYTLRLFLPGVTKGQELVLHKVQHFRIEICSAR